MIGSVPAHQRRRCCRATWFPGNIAASQGRTVISGFQVSGDAPAFYAGYGYAMQEPWTDDLIRQARCKDGDRVLDVACGPGLVAGRVNRVSNATCKITGIDINEAMLSAARKIPDIDWHLGSATELPFADGSFEVVFCQQGLQFFPDRAAAMREMCRVLTPGGRLSLNVWGPLDRQPFDVVYRDCVRAFFGPQALIPSSLGFSLNTAGELRKLATDAGLRDVRIRFEHRTARHAVMGEFLTGWTQASPIAAQFRAFSEEMRNRFIAYLSERLEDYVDDGGIAIPRENHFLIAMR
jgi:SAM-dependent methyltransferase